MTALRHPAPSDEATWTGIGRVWAHVQQFAPRKRFAVEPGWLLALVGVVFVAGALAVMR